MNRLRLGILLFALTALASLTGLKVGDPPGVQMQLFADAFLDTLNEEETATAVMPYNDERRVDWHFIPKKERKGLMMGQMNESQRAGALRLLRAALSEIGYFKSQQIRELEQVLHVLEGDGGNWDRDPMRYYVTIFGKPSDTDAWGFSFEGHHLSLNFVCRGGKIVDSTPQFMAANPATIMTRIDDPSVNLNKGTRVLRDEEQLAFDLVNSLNPAQATDAVIAEEAPSEIRFAGEPQADVAAPEGIAYATLNGKQRQVLRQLINTYIEVAPENIARQRTRQIIGDGWENIHFAWAGAKKPGIGHYYRIRGDSFLIEFVNTQADAVGNPANHIHCVYRDLTGDFDLPPAE